MTHTYKGFRLIDGAIDNAKCPHLHFVNDNGRIRCQACGDAELIRRYEGGCDVIATATDIIPFTGGTR